jgi:murein L,D-transpeptidase YafK
VSARHLVLLILAALALTGALSGAWAQRPVPASFCAGLSDGGGARRLVYIKAEHQLCLLDARGVAWERRASHGREPGKKRFEGDGRTPEGQYTVAAARVSQRFGLFMPISYPSAEDVRRARAEGKDAGGNVGIHGPQRWYAFLGRAQALIDHSDGCIVLDAEGIEELAALVKKPVPIEILPAAPGSR